MELLGFEATPGFREQYLDAVPFPHLVFEQFFDPSFCQQLIDSFPSTEQAKLFTEYGRKIGKATVEHVDSLGPVYGRLDALFRSDEFLSFLESVTGISGLLFDPAYIGGGTHENLDGQALHPHVDFNYHPENGWYRRLNLLIYLNRGWQPDWGGNLSLSADPEDESADEVTLAPAWNRGVLFATSERSWHGFDRLRLADAPAGTTRRSLSVYYYTLEPPPEAGPAHSTIYIPPAVATARDDRERAALDEEREAFLQYLRTENHRLAADISNLQRELRQTRQALQLPTFGYLRQEGFQNGFHHDRWVDRQLSCVLVPAVPIESLRLRGYRPGPEPQTLTVLVDGAVAVKEAIHEAGPFDLCIPCPRDADESFALTVSTSPPAAASGDGRELGFVILEVSPGPSD